MLLWALGTTAKTLVWGDKVKIFREVYSVRMARGQQAEVP